MSSLMAWYGMGGRDGGNGYPWLIERGVLSDSERESCEELEVRTKAGLPQLRCLNFYNLIAVDQPLFHLLSVLYLEEGAERGCCSMA
jgi:hypothetical protein